MRFPNRTESGGGDNVTCMPALNSPPGPIGLPLLGVLPQFRADPAGYMLATARKFGEISHFRLGFRHIYLIDRPDVIEEVLVHNASAFRKSKMLQLARVMLGDGLLTAEGEHHLRHRKLIQPVFYRDRLAGYARTVTECAMRARSRWQPGQTFDVAQEMQRLTLAVVGRTLFGSDVEEDAAHIGTALSDLLSAFDTMLMPGAALLQRLSLTPRLRRVSRARRELDRFVYRMIAERREKRANYGDLLSLLIDASAEGSGRLTDTEVRDEALTLLLAGHETTANALTWTWYLLSQHPEAEARFHQELRDILGDREPEWDDIPRLSYTERVLSESMRLYPPAWAIGRQNQAQLRLFNSLVRAKSIVVMSPWVTHRNPTLWPDPERFDPDRFLPEEKARRPKFAYFPFGGGPRVCIGERFAWMEAMLVLAAVGRRWRFCLVRGHPVQVHARLTLRPRFGMKMTAEHVIA
jgi:cytochrome P450